MKNYIPLLLFSFLLVFPQHAKAKYKMGDKKPISVEKEKAKKERARRKRFNKEYQFMPLQQSTVDEATILNNLSLQYEIEVKKLEYLRGLRHGYRELINGLIIAQESQAEIGRILDYRVKGKSWKYIAKKFNIDYKPFIMRSEEEIDVIRPSVPDPLIEERPKIRRF